MTSARTDLAALVGSRICHDLISPVGAINNGLELLELGGSLQSGPEMDLIRDSVEAAAARIKFFRIAFGHADRRQQIALRDLNQILSDMNRDARVKLSWSGPSDPSRCCAQMGLLAALCIEVALPRGGEARIAAGEGTVCVTGSGPHLQYDSELWDKLAAGCVNDVTAARVQFLLLPELATAAGYQLSVGNSPDSLHIDLTRGA